MKRSPVVYVPNKSFHDFGNALKYGELVFLTEGMVNRFGVNQLYRRCHYVMQDAIPEDYLLISSLPIINAVAASILAARFGRINFLIFKDSDYIVREALLNGEWHEGECTE